MARCTVGPTRAARALFSESSDQTPKEHLGQALRDRRKERHLTQELAQQARIVKSGYVGPCRHIHLRCKLVAQDAKARGNFQCSSLSPSMS